MDRNTFTGIVLIALIMLVWLYWFAPTPPPPTDERALAQADSLAAAEPLPEAPAAPDTVAADAATAAVEQGREQFVTVETDLYTARFSSRGATLRSFLLKRYDQYDQETPVQIVDTTRAGAIGLAFTTPSSHNVDTRSLYFSLPDSARLAGGVLRAESGPAELVFQAPVGSGSIRQIYTFTPGSYEVKLRVEMQNAASFTTNSGYELIWDGGVPFSEIERKSEALSAGAYARSGGEVESIGLASETEENLTLSGKVDWMAVKSHFFTAVVIPASQTTGAVLEGARTGEPDDPAVRESYTIRLLMPRPAAEADAYRFFLGPMEFYRISDYDLGLYGMVDYGWGGWITRPLAEFIFLPVFHFLGNLISNYGIVIILFAILVKLLLYPLTKSTYVNMARMRELQPKMEAIKAEHADDPQKQQQAIMKMYKDTGINPLGGCLPTLLQMPLLIALWRFFPNSILIRQEGFLWANDLSAPDPILHLPFTVPFYGSYVAGFTLLMGLSLIVQMRVQGASSPQSPETKIMTYIFPVMLFLFFNQVASGLSLYYLVFNIVTAVQQQWINRSLEKQGLSVRKTTADKIKVDTKPNGGNGRPGRGQKPVARRTR